MIGVFNPKGRMGRTMRAGVIAAVLGLAANPLSAEGTGGVLAYRQAVAESAAASDSIAAFYRARDYAPLWTGQEDAQRRQAFLTALSMAADHGLPAGRHDPQPLIAGFHAVRSERERGLLEAEMTRAFVQYARDIQSGVLEPARVDSGIVRSLPRRDVAELLSAFEAAEPVAFLRALPPQTPEYARLMKEKRRLEGVIAQGGWGPAVQAGKLMAGDSGAAVIALRDRLIAMEYMPRGHAGATFDAALHRAVQQFQTDHGLESDGIVGRATLAELNKEPVDRLKSVLVALERERWMNFDRGDRHIWANLADFSVRVIDHGRETFVTRAIIGKDLSDQRTPEFSDMMRFMVVNPSWNVPRSITTKEYLPQLQQNPNAVDHLQIINSRGQVINREGLDFTQYSARSFPYSMRQAPGASNALGKVKFMFPNKYDIYLHDTPHKSLFTHDVRAFSHGCVRLNDPFDFAHTLLAAQEENPKAVFQRHLESGREVQVNLKQPVPIHLVYNTAFVSPKGVPQYRRDIYGRDARLFAALAAAGVALPGVEG